MQKFISILIILSFFFVATPVHAGLVTDFDPVEQDQKKQMEDEMSRDFRKPAKTVLKDEDSGSSWWKWTLGVVVVGGVAAAAAGGKKSGGGDTAQTSTGGSTTVTW